MLIGEFADLVLGRLDYSTVENLKTNRRNVLVMGDTIRSEMLSAAMYSGTKVNGQWQYNIGNDLKELPGILFISKCTPVQCVKNRYFSILPGEVMTFKGKSGILLVKPPQTYEAEQGANINLQSDRTYFVQQKLGASLAYGILESAQLTGNIGYEIKMRGGTPGIIEYNNFQPGFCPEVEVTYLPRLWNGGLTEDDMMPMDDTFTKELIDLCVISFTQQKSSSRDKVEGE